MARTLSKEPVVTTPQSARVAEIEAWLLDRVHRYDIRVLQPENPDHKLALEEAWEKFAPEHWVASPESRSFRVDLPITFHMRPESATSTTYDSPTYLISHEGPVPLSWPLLSRTLADPQAIETAEQLRAVLLARMRSLPASFRDLHFSKGVDLSDRPPRWAIREIRRTLTPPTQLPTFPRGEAMAGPVLNPLIPAGNLCDEMMFRSTELLQRHEDRHAMAIFRRVTPLLTEHERGLAEDFRRDWDQHHDPALNVFDPLVQLYDRGFSLSDVEDFGSKAPLLVNVEW